tara:strand:+ start:436 stop:786 length:351 start_codon:yes stop_codon:yes gene_type:complete
MPVYLFINPFTEETKEVLQKMNEPHIYIDKEGIEWNRLYTPPNTSIDGRINPMDEGQFVEKTKNMKNFNYGHAMDLAKEQSEKRIQKEGYDPVQKEWFKDYSKKRKGKKHPSDPSK